MSEDEQRSQVGDARLTLSRSRPLQRFRLPGAALHLWVCDGVIAVSGHGAVERLGAGSDLVVPPGQGVVLAAVTARAEIRVRCRPPGAEAVLARLAGPGDDDPRSRVSSAADGGIELLLDPVPESLA